MSRISTVFILTLLVVSLAPSASLAKPFVFEVEAVLTGEINKDLVTGDATARTDLPASWGLINDTEWRGYLDFDTTALDGLRFPDILSVELYYGHSIAATEDADYFRAEFYVGDFMADGLSVADWDAGTYATTYSWYDYIESTVIDLGQEGINMLWNFDGGSVRFDPPAHYSVTFRNAGPGGFVASTRHCKLRITYYKNVRKSPEEYR